ncbi:hypothetical protein EVAR_12589_1 [Eumeta japonica]|uniref:Uncharacterized protein n=1 Tax=Eumeta variegata TaxID=151549 RepID=A0A4C1UEL1_EUMVA|nr:hypothetical protein EVAR_12589_1 [Eumeta japonica]
MRSLRSTCGLSLRHRWRSSGVRERCGLKGVVTRVERGMLRLLGHLEKTDESRLTKQIYRTKVSHGKLPPRKSAPRISCTVASENGFLAICGYNDGQRFDDQTSLLQQELYMWRSEYNCDGSKNSTAINRVRIHLCI